jgi:hypothetical protein
MCLIPTGITRQCTYGFGGLSAVYLGNRDYIVAGKNSSNTVTGFTMSSGEKFYKFEAEPETSQLIEELQSGNASKFIQQTVNFTLAGIDQVKREVLEKLGLAKITAVVQYQSGEYYLAGIDGSGLKAVTLTIDSGTANADLNGAVVSLVGGSLGFANEVTSAAVAAAIA